MLPQLVALDKQVDNVIENKGKCHTGQYPVQREHNDSRLIDKLIAEDVLTPLREVKYLGSPVDREGNADGGGNGDNHLIDCVIEPRPPHVGILGDVLVLVTVQQVIDDSNGLDEGQLHDPPDEHLHTHQGVAHPRHDCGHRHHDERDPRVEDVATRHSSVVTTVDNQLPDGKHQQQDREDHINHGTGQEHNTEEEHHKAQQQHRHIELDATLDSVTVYADDN